MVSRQRSSDEEGEPRRRPATSPESRELELASYAFDLAEKQLRDGTASAQVITHFLKLATEREKLEMVRLKSENRLLEAKAENLASQQKQEELFAEALKAMTIYKGDPDNVEIFDE